MKHTIHLHILLGLLFIASHSYGQTPSTYISIGGAPFESTPGKTLSGKNGHIAISENGRDWELAYSGGEMTNRFSYNENNLIRGLTYGKGQFVAVGNIGNGILTSPDARTWTVVTRMDNLIGGGCIAYGNDLFVVMRTGDFITSSDARTWTKHSMFQQVKEMNNIGIWGEDGAGQIREIVFGNGTFVFSGDRRIGASKDGKTLIHHEVFERKKKSVQQSLLFGAGRFVLLTEFGHRSSTDGIVWEDLIIDDSDPEAMKVQHEGAWNGHEFLARGHRCIYRSKDGLSWEKVAVEKGAPRIRAACGASIIGPVRDRGFTISTDTGKTWEIIESPVSRRQMYYFDGSTLYGSGGG